METSADARGQSIEERKAAMMAAMDDSTPASSGAADAEVALQASIAARKAAMMAAMAGATSAAPAGSSLETSAGVISSSGGGGGFGGVESSSSSRGKMEERKAAMIAAMAEDAAPAAAAPSSSSVETSAGNFGGVESSSSSRGTMEERKAAMMAAMAEDAATAGSSLETLSGSLSVNFGGVESSSSSRGQSIEERKPAMMAAMADDAPAAGGGARLGSVESEPELDSLPLGQRPVKMEYQQGSAAGLMVTSLLSEKSEKDILSMDTYQQQTVRRLQDSVERLADFNDFSQQQFEDIGPKFATKSRQLKLLKKDLDDVFKRIRKLKETLRAAYPEAVAAAEAAHPPPVPPDD